MPYRGDGVRAVAVLHNRMFVTLRQLSMMELSVMQMDGDILNADELKTKSFMPLEYKRRWHAPENCHGRLCVGEGQRADSVLDELLQLDAVLHRV